MTSEAREAAEILANQIWPTHVLQETETRQTFERNKACFIRGYMKCEEKWSKAIATVCAEAASSADRRIVGNPE